jgi:hypothetical protein
MSSVVWLHDDALRHWWGEAPAVYVFDAEKILRENWSLKRIGFIYECLLELPLEIRRGDPVAEVRAFCEMQGADGVICMDSPDPRLRRQMNQLKAEIVPLEPFLSFTGKVDLRRFSRYWTKAEPALLALADNLKT